MIGIIDYGMGNLGSVTNAFAFLDIPYRLVTRPVELDGCDAVTLPGVGGFADCMRHLDEHGFTGAVRDWVEQGKPYLGICLGLQVLFESSEEAPGVQGLSIMKGVVKRFEEAQSGKIPQIGWNRVRQKRDGFIYKDIPDDTFFYFVHSYYVEPVEKGVTAGITEYGRVYTSVVRNENVVAVQFHPEKSQQFGLTLLKNFGTHIGPGAF